MARKRPKTKRTGVRLCLRLNPELPEDAAIVEWMETLPFGLVSKYVKRALAAVAGQLITDRIPETVFTIDQATITPKQRSKQVDAESTVVETPPPAAVKPSRVMGLFGDG